MLSSAHICFSCPAKKQKEACGWLRSAFIIWFFVTLSIESSVIPINDVIFEHRLYLPSFGVFLAFAATAAFSTKISGRTYALVVVTLACILAGATWTRNLVWKNESTLWSDVVAKSPLKARAHYNLGKSLSAANRLDEAIDHLQTALRLPIYAKAMAQAHAILGAAYVQKGLPDWRFNTSQPPCGRN